jgi:tRNA(fMet)-specific endonuclease VapC
VQKVLVDSSVWIDFFRRTHSSPVDVLGELVREDLACMTPIIRAELLSGTRSEAEYRMLEDRLGSVGVLSEPEDLWNQVAWARFRMARRGLQTSIVDVSIAVMARTHGCLLFTLDRQFSRMAKTIPFKLYSIPQS